MQRPLSFRKITAHEAQQQRERIAQELATALASVPPPAPAPPRRTVGRPKRERTLAEAAAAAAAAAAPEKADSEEQPAAKRGKYTNWFTSPYLNDVLRAYAWRDTAPDAPSQRCSAPRRMSATHASTTPRCAAGLVLMAEPCCLSIRNSTSRRVLLDEGPVVRRHWRRIQRSRKRSERCCGG